MSIRRTVRRLSSVFFVILSVFGPEAACSDLIAYWHFNDENLTVDQGAGTLISSFLAGDIKHLSGTTINALPGVPVPRDSSGFTPRGHCALAYGMRYPASD